jgi:hypothetical protein
MNEDALRALVRDVIGRIESGNQQPISDAQPAESVSKGLIHLSAHPSHYQYTLPPSDGPCFIEPGVRCNHCGYCQTHGH